MLKIPCIFFTFFFFLNQSLFMGIFKLSDNLPSWAILRIWVTASYGVSRINKENSHEIYIFTLPYQKSFRLYVKNSWCFVIQIFFALIVLLITSRKINWYSAKTLEKSSSCTRCYSLKFWIINQFAVQPWKNNSFWLDSCSAFVLRVHVHSNIHWTALILGELLCCHHNSYMLKQELIVAVWIQSYGKNLPNSRPVKSGPHESQ